MRSICKRGIALVLLCYLSPGACNRTDSDERREHRHLEDLLQKMDTTNEPDQLRSLRELEQQTFESNPVREVHRICVAAYNSYLITRDQITTMRMQTETLEREIENSPNPARVQQQHRDALELMADAKESLNRSESLLHQCHEMRISLSRRLHRP